MHPFTSPGIHPAIDPLTQPRAFLQHLFQVAVQRALPQHTLAAHLPAPPEKGRTVVIGAGKAAGAMAQAFDALWPADDPLHAPLQGLVVTRYGHTPPLQPTGLRPRIEVLEAAHPVPDAAGMAASERMMALVQGLSANDLVVCLISGGGSALLTLPADGLTLADKQRINQQLLDSGAHIGEMNCVRKHLSRIKGGRLAAACAPARLVTLAISDVPGDDPSTIASGPTVADATTCADALAILRRYQIDLPATVTDALVAGTLETPKPGDPLFAGHSLQMIATPMQSLQAAADAARALGVAAHILSDEIEGESREVGKVHAALARFVARHGEQFSAGPPQGKLAPLGGSAAHEVASVGATTFSRPCVLLSGGETTVTVKPLPAGGLKGRGGRAGEFCLGLAQALQGRPGVYALAADTDGIDGVEDNAGAFVAPDTLQRADAQGLKLAQHLDRNDSYGFFHALGDLVTTGPTHTNVNDFRALLIL